MPYAAVVLLCYLVGTDSASISRTSLALHAEEGLHWNPFTAVAEGLQWNPFKAVADAVSRKWSGVDKMRGDLCWDREDMLNHEKCMKWMVKKCKSEDANPKRCDKLKNYVKDKCMNSEDAEDKELACDYAKDLGISIEPTMEVAAMPAPAPAAPPAGAPSPASVPAPAEEEEAAAPAPAVEEVKKEEAVKEEKKEEAVEEEAPTEEGGTTGKPPKLQSQGFEGKPVRHRDGKTMSSDWGDEYEHPTTTTKAPPRSGAQAHKCRVAIPVLGLALSWAACHAF